jgi:hypothetical protein
MGRGAWGRAWGLRLLGARYLEYGGGEFLSRATYREA